MAAEHGTGESHLRQPSAKGAGSGVNLEVLTEQLEQVCSQAQVGLTELPWQGCKLLAMHVRP